MQVRGFNIEPTILKRQHRPTTVSAAPHGQAFQSLHHAVPLSAWQLLAMRLFKSEWDLPGAPPDLLVAVASAPGCGTQSDLCIATFSFSAGTRFLVWKPAWSYRSDEETHPLCHPLTTKHKWVVVVLVAERKLNNVPQNRRMNTLPNKDCKPYHARRINDSQHCFVVRGAVHGHGCTIPRTM
jgi:hypothetical protein